ncbi:uncharacterized protein LOC134186822 [Corticium candelabrum]|uniref:uncharacterized protein LOC134186822 n=1 Tax=Corticium candelabrum TaxID=121492 RepID=UPI002E25C259|nr:uncharacterized protein LOC134186822 [Corticium candelabrum]
MKKAASDFTSCLMSSLKPACFCELCFDEYYNLSKVYCSIHSSKHCFQPLLAGDSTYAIEEFYNFARATWETRGHCSNCFNGSQLNGNVKDFYIYLSSFDRCIHNASNNYTVCNTCKQDYRALMEFYNSKFGRDPSKVCADVSDHMNSSMYKWRIAYKCPEGENPVLTVSLFTSGVLILTALFYVCVYVWGRREQKKDMTQKRIKRSKSKSHSRSLSPDGVKNKEIESQIDLSTDSATLN